MHLAKRPSQTMLEMVIAIGVIIAAVITSMSLIITTITAGRASQNRIEAANIAREGIEVVRGIRDANWLRRVQNVTDANAQLNLYQWDMNPRYDAQPITDVNKFLGGATGSGPHYYQIQYTTPNPIFKNQLWQLVACSAPCTLSARNIWYDNVTNHVYTQVACASCTLTRFKRRITITKVNDTSITLGTADYLDVLSEVQWMEKARTRTIKAQERLYDWQ